MIACRSRHCAAVLALLLAAAAQLHAQIPSDSIIRAIIKDRVDSKRSAAIVVGATDPGGTQRIVGYGKEREGGADVGDLSVFEIGSITKVFTASILADMVTKGEVKLDDPVAKYLPANVKIPTRGGREITLLDLATQSSGLPRMPSNFSPKDPANPYADYSVQQMYDFLAAYTLPRDIGVQYEYSNLGVGLLGHALALRAGMSYEDLVRQRVLNPLGMDHTGIKLTDAMAAHLAVGHNQSGKVVANWDLPTFAGAGALRSDARDMLKFLKANIDSTQSPLAREMQMTHVSRHATQQPSLTLGLNWHILDVAGDTIIWHNGGTGGYRTFTGFMPSKKVGIVVLSNSATSVDDIGMHLLSEKVPLQKPPKDRKEIAVAGPVLEQYVGDYELAPNFVITVTHEGTGLFAQATGQLKLQLHPETEMDFFLKEVDAQLTFMKDAAGKVTELVLHQGGANVPGRKIR